MLLHQCIISDHYDHCDGYCIVAMIEVPLKNCPFLAFLSATEAQIFVGKQKIGNYPKNIWQHPQNKRFLASKWIGVCKIYSMGNNKLYIENAKRQVLSVAQQ